MKDRPSFLIQPLVFVVCLFFDRDDAFEMAEILLGPSKQPASVRAVFPSLGR